MLLHKGERKPGAPQPKQGTGNHTQYPGAFAPAEQLSSAIQGHRQDHQYPYPPGDTRQAFFAEDKDQSPQEHRAVDEEVTHAQIELMPKEVEGKSIAPYACIMPTLSLPASVNQRVWFAPPTIPIGKLEAVGML